MLAPLLHVRVRCGSLRCGAVRSVSMAPAFRGLVRAACRFRLPRAICAACASRQAVEP